MAVAAQERRSFVAVRSAVHRSLAAAAVPQQGRRPAAAAEVSLLIAGTDVLDPSSAQAIAKNVRAA
ncbi:MAG TPA: hypothetical protein VG276_12330 [Actinomycetes bacterium]|jgi:hypothetical protein|nr:hypothetical protein [Actinomycetes bacterium]